MRLSLLGAALLALAFSTPANAIGCFSGAVAGGIAGHVAHHGVLGAIGGCVAGHEYNKHLQRQQELEQQNKTGQAGQGS